MVANGIGTAISDSRFGTPATGVPTVIGDWPVAEDCQPCREDWTYGDAEKRSRIDANKGKRSKALKKNRKAAKAARKARKK